MKKRLPHAALLLISALLAGAVIFLTWPARAAIFCEQLPQLTALAVCAATLLVFSFRALALTHAGRSKGPTEDMRVAGSAAILAALAFFLAAHFVTTYRKPCVAVERQLIQHGEPGPVKSR